jgi:hypothetical protein
MVLIMNISWIILDRTLWETALALDKTMATDNIFYPKRFTLYKEIYMVTPHPNRREYPVQKRMFGM